MEHPLSWLAGSIPIPVITVSSGASPSSLEDEMRFSELRAVC